MTALQKQGTHSHQMELASVASRAGLSIGDVTPMFDYAKAARFRGPLTRLQEIAYHNGVAAGCARKSTEHNPYADGRAKTNFMRGDNDPRRAWEQGRVDGARIRSLFLEPETMGHTVSRAEYRILPAPHQKAIDAALTSKEPTNV